MFSEVVPLGTMGGSVIWTAKTAVTPGANVVLGMAMVATMKAKARAMAVALYLTALVLTDIVLSELPWSVEG